MVMGSCCIASLFWGNRREETKKRRINYAQLRLAECKAGLCAFSLGVLCVCLKSVYSIYLGTPGAPTKTTLPTLRSHPEAVSAMPEI